LRTGEISDIGRKLDKGVKLLEALPDIKIGIDMMNTKFDAFADEQRTFNRKMGSHTKLMGAHNLRLEQILQKLIEK